MPLQRLRQSTTTEFGFRVGVDTTPTRRQRSSCRRQVGDCLGKYHDMDLRYRSAFLFSWKRLVLRIINKDAKVA